MHASEALRIESLLELVEREVHVVPIVLGRREHELVLGAEPEDLVALENQLALTDAHRQPFEVLRVLRRTAERAEQQREAARQLLGSREIVPRAHERLGEPLRT